MPAIHYHGYRDGTTAVIAVEDETGQVIGMVRHVVKHSPTGLNWGYGGSGPADTARSLLIAAIGEDSAGCSTCAATGRVMYDEQHAYRAADMASDPVYDVASCSDCDEGYRRLPYQAFKWEYVAGWRDEWRISRTEILSWLADHNEA